MSNLMYAQTNQTKEHTDSIVSILNRAGSRSLAPMCMVKLSKWGRDSVMDALLNTWPAATYPTLDFLACYGSCSP